MYRPRIEKLEERRLFSVTDLIIDPFQARAAVAENGHQAAAIVDFVDADELASQFDGALRTESVSKDERITTGGNRTVGVAVGDVNGDGRANLLDGLDGGIWRNRITPTSDGNLAIALVGDFNGDGPDDFGRTAGASNLIIVVWADVPAGDQLLPYIEQDNLYKFSEPDHTAVGIVDGTSNTVMFGEYAGFIAALYRDSTDASQDRSIPRSAENISSIDVWEHAYSAQHAYAGGTTTAFPDVAKQTGSPQPGASTNGIIAILIGLMVDPTNRNVVYVGGSRSSAFVTTDAQGPTYLALQGAGLRVADGSVRFLGSNNLGIAPSILASDEYFSRFSNTTLDDEALLATTFGRGDRASQVTHDEEFENWASASRFDRGYLSLGYEMSDLLVTGVRAGHGG